MKVTRRELLRLASAGTGGLVLAPLAGCGDSAPVASGTDTARRLDFTAMPDGDHWAPGWSSVGVANLRRENSEGLLEAGSDVFPNDPRPVAFARDQRFADGSIRAVLARAGSGAGVVLRRVSIHHHYAAVYAPHLHTLSIVRRSGFDQVRLATVLVSPLAAPDPASGASVTLELEAAGVHPTRLQARFTGADDVVYETAAVDDDPALQAAGDAGVLAQADTLLPDGQDDLLPVPALGNLRLLPYGVQEGMAFLESPVGQAMIGQITQRSTAGFLLIEIRPAVGVTATIPALVAATTGAPRPGGARVHVATDAPADIAIEVAATPDFGGARRIEAGVTDPVYHAATADITGLAPGPAYWRPRIRHAGGERVGPARRFTVLPPAGDPAPFTLAYGACASHFGRIFDRLAERAPELFIWQGDLNYPDTNGPLAQSDPGYAGMWRHFLDNPRLAPILANTAFVAGRDDHDYGLQDANSTNLPPWGLAPWEALMNPLTYQRLSAGLADIWLLDQRRFKSDPALPDTTDKTLLGEKQRRWLFDGLAASSAPFQIICSPNTLAHEGTANARDGSWAAGFKAERDLLLAHIAEHVAGQVVFLTGDTHFTMVWDRDGLFEQRACPLDIPLPNDQNISNPMLGLTFGSTPGVVYWSRRGHFSMLTVGAQDGQPLLTVELVRDDGVSVQTTRFDGAG